MKIIPMENKGPGAWGALKNERSGLLMFDGVKFKAERSIDNYFAALGKGSRGQMGCPRRKDGRITSEIFLLAAVRSKDCNPNFAKRCRMAHLMRVAGDPDVGILIDDADRFDEYAGRWFVELVRVSDNGVSIAAKWVESIEDRIRDLTCAEDDFIRSIEQAAEDCGNVPTQKAVCDLWLDKDPDRQVDYFPDIRDALGFGWLPKARSARKRT